MRHRIVNHIILTINVIVFFVLSSSAQDTLVIGQSNKIPYQNIQCPDLSSSTHQFLQDTPCEISFTLHNPGDLDTTVDIRFNVEKAFLYVNNAQDPVHFGFYHAGHYYASYQNYAPVMIPAKRAIPVRVVVEQITNYDRGQASLEIVDTEFKRTEKMNTLYRNKPSYTVMFLFQGAILIMMIYIGLMSFQNRRRMYLYYALYMLGVGLYYYTRLDEFFGFNYVLPNAPHWKIIINQPIQLFFFVFYSLFVLDFLDLEKHDRLLTKIIRAAIWVYIAFIVLIPAYIVITGDYDTIRSSMPITFGAISIFSPICLVRFLTNGPERLSKYIISGTGLLTIFSFIALLLSFDAIGTNGRLLGINLFPICWSQIGTLLEILCFSLGLGYKMRKDAEDKKIAQDQLIQSLEENARLHQEINKELEVKVEERAQVIEAQSKALEEERSNRLRQEYDQKLSVMEMAALKAQMNPHFVFNALNSIKALVLKGQEEDAVTYLNKFSKLMRNILNSSNETLVSLEDELETCKLYMDIESKRFGDNFEYSIQVDPSLDPSFIMLPSMLLQPFVENAIWHGLLHKEGHRALDISVRRQGDYVNIIIADNGIGREAAAAIRSKQSTRQKSYGMKISSDRIHLYNQLYGSNIQQTIRDKVDAHGQATGTDVFLHIPISN